MLTIEQCKAVKIKLISMGQKQNYLAQKLKITPQRLSNILNRKVESLGVEKKIIKFITD